ncbi:MAG: hypothetical protein JWQ79_420 [Mucilaginibacter sp.]|nr:hypothetical protein [Mucilaginibacter sp.]
MKLLLKNGWLSLALLLSLTTLLIYLTGHYILTLGFYVSNGDPLSGIPGQDERVYEMMQKWIYLSSVLYLLLKVGVISLILHTALYLQDKDISIHKIFKVTILAEYIFLIPAAIKILTFHYTFPTGTLLEWHKYYIFSAISIFNEAPVDWSYALQTLNAFEIGYWFLLAYGVSRITDLNFDRSLHIVVTSYVPALIVWIAVITFFTLVVFPTTG